MTILKSYKNNSKKSLNSSVDWKTILFLLTIFSLNFYFYKLKISTKENANLKVLNNILISHEHYTKELNSEKNLKQNIEKTILIEKCNCAKRIKYNVQYNFSSYNEPNLLGNFSTTCNKYADERGVNQNIISFSLFNDNEPGEVTTRSDLFKGVHANYEAAQIIYPGWILRIYSDLKINEEICNQIICKYPDLDWCDINEMPKIKQKFLTKRAWRFLVLGDPFVHKFISRDLDSIVGEREQAAVKEWEESDFIFHSMRDHDQHFIGMLAGMWGAKVNLFQNATQITKKIINIAKSSIKEHDQYLINFVLYRRYKKLFICHDPYFCKFFLNSRPFPTRRKDNLDWIGSFKVIPAKLMRITKKCRKECRPKYGKDWEFC